MNIIYFYKNNLILQHFKIIKLITLLKDEKNSSFSVTELTILLSLNF